MAFRIGQKVVFLGSDNPSEEARALRHGFVIPVKGVVYTVRDLTDYGGPGLRLVEIVNPVRSWAGYGHVEPSWHQSRFRPAVERKTSISIFKEILDRENHGLPSRVDYPADCEPK